MRKLPVLASITHQWRGVTELDRLDAAADERLETDLLGRHQVTADNMAKAGDHRSELAVGRGDFLERIDRICAREDAREALVTRLEDVHDEAAPLDQEVVEVRERIDEPEEKSRISLGHEDRGHGDAGLS